MMMTRSGPGRSGGSDQPLLPGNHIISRQTCRPQSRGWCGWWLYYGGQYYNVATTTSHRRHNLINISHRGSVAQWLTSQPTIIKTKTFFSLSLSLPLCSSVTSDLIHRWCIRCLMQCLIDVSASLPPPLLLLLPVYFIPPGG